MFTICLPPMSGSILVRTVSTTPRGCGCKGVALCQKVTVVCYTLSIHVLRVIQQRIVVQKGLFSDAFG
jgi:hypothetical protein